MIQNLPIGKSGIDRYQLKIDKSTTQFHLFQNEMKAQFPYNQTEILQRNRKGPRRFGGGSQNSQRQRQKEY